MKRFALLILCLFVFQLNAQVTYDFSYTGNVQQINLSPGIYRIECWGAQGGDGYNTTGGNGGYAVGELQIASVTTLHLYVGGQGQHGYNGRQGGYNGGGDGGLDTGSGQNAGGGGGATDARMNGATLNHRIIIAGGGAGGGRDGITGVGGGSSGTGSTAYSIGYPGNPGTQSAGGTAYATNRGATDGQLGIGGNGSTGHNAAGGGGGGGGYYGGGGGVSTADHGAGWSAGGGGGSGYIGALLNSNLIAGNLSMPNGLGSTMIGNAGNGFLRITQLYSVSIAETQLINCYNGNNGSLTATVNGGTAPYSFAWSNGSTTSNTNSLTNVITGLTAGNYSVTITDNNSISTSTTFTLTQPPVLSSVIGVDSNVSCNNGADGGITVQANGGISPYTYVWNNANTTATIDNLTAATYHVTITDGNGCTTTNSETVTQPTSLMASITVDSNVTCNGFTNGGITANISGGTPNYSYSWSNSATTSSMVGLSAGNYSVTITDGEGCTVTESQTVTEPAVLSALVVADSMVSCTGNNDGGLTASATGGNSPYLYMWSNGATTSSISQLAIANYTVTITDFNGCTDDSSFAIILTDTIAPVVVTQNDTVYLDASGIGSIHASDIDNGSTDACNIASMTLDSMNFDCSEIGSNTVTLTVTDVNGNSSSATATVTVMDTAAPVALAQDLTIYLDANGAATITTNDIDNGSSDNCSIATLALDSTDFDCSEVGANTVVLTVTDVNGNSSNAAAIVTVMDTVSPVVMTQNNTIYLDANGEASITTNDIDNGSDDNCSIATLALDSTDFDCSEVGANTVVLTVTDVNGNSSSATALVTVLDTVAPIVMTQNATFYLDVNGVASVDANLINDGSYDNCGLDTMYLDSTQFDCSELGPHTVTLTVVDVNGNSSTQTAIATVMDTLLPTVLTQDITVYLDALGTATIAVNNINNGSFTTCGIDTMYLDSTHFDCSEVGINTVALTVEDVNGNSQTATATVTVLDTIAPVAIANTATFSLDSNGMFVLDPMSIGSGSSDNCSIDSMWVSQDTFTCNDLGPHLIQLFVQDASGYQDQVYTAININDSIAPTVHLYSNVQVYLNSAGLATLSVSDIDSSSMDNCGIVQSSINQTSFDCSQVGSNVVYFTAEDAVGNITIDSTVVWVYDTIAPQLTLQTAIKTLDSNGMVTLSVADLVTSASDICGVDSIGLSASQLNCSHVGANVIYVTVQDINGNVYMDSTTVVVQDVFAPVVQVSNTTISVGSTSLITLTDSVLGLSFVENCSVDSFHISPAQLSCADLGMNVITVYSEDVNGNANTATFVVTLIDDIAPTLLHQTHVTMYLDSTGNAELMLSDVDTGSYDNCSAVSLSLSQNNFSCQDLGSTYALFTGQDGYGNQSTDTVWVNVVDTIAPEITCVDTIFACEGEVNFDLPSAYDNCAFSLVNTGNVLSGDTLGMGEYTLEFTATDSDSNQTICTTVLVVNPRPVFSLGADTTLAVGDILNLILNDTTLNYEWSTGDSSASIAHTASLSEIIWATGTNQYGCSYTDSLSISIFNGLVEFGGGSVEVYPNPVKDILSLDLSDAKETSYDLVLMDGTGKLVKSLRVDHISDATLRLDVRDVANGVYFLRLTGKQSQYQFKITKM